MSKREAPSFFDNFRMDAVREQAAILNLDIAMFEMPAKTWGHGRVGEMALGAHQRVGVGCHEF